MIDGRALLLGRRMTEQSNPAAPSPNRPELAETQLVWNIVRALLVGPAVLLSLLIAYESDIISGLPSYPATVTIVDRVADAASGTFRVRLTLPNPGHDLPAGLRCSVRFQAVEPDSEVMASNKSSASVPPAVPVAKVEKDSFIASGLIDTVAAGIGFHPEAPIPRR